MEAKEVKSRQVVVIGIDPGSTHSGVIILVNGQIASAITALNEEIIPLVRNYLGTKYTLRVMVEDLAPYSLKLTPDVLATANVIGELKYRLMVARISFELITRSEVKDWAYSAYNDLLSPLVKEKVRSRAEKKGLPELTLEGEERKGSHVWLDDRLITKAMRLHWGLEYKRGRLTAHGLDNHSFQALALATLYHVGYMPELKAKRKKKDAEKAKKKLLKLKKKGSQTK